MPKCLKQNLVRDRPLKIWKNPSNGKVVRFLCLLDNGEILLEYKNRVIVSYDPKKGKFTDLVFQGIPHWFQTVVHAGSFNWINTPSWFLKIAANQKVYIFQCMFVLVESTFISYLHASHCNLWMLLISNPNLATLDMNLCLQNTSDEIWRSSSNKLEKYTISRKRKKKKSSTTISTDN